jgi:hypothetical protein
MISMVDGEWLVPFKGRNSSAYWNLNFLWRYKNIYVMDNHRAALWCWLQHVDPSKAHALFHIDQHFDTLTSRMEAWLKRVPSSWNMSIDEYLGLFVEHADIPGKLPLFGWDNYLSIYLELFGSHLTSRNFATHNVGDKPILPIYEHAIWDVPQNLDYWLKPDYAPWIMNCDLDYFFCDDADDRPPQRFLSNAFIERCFDAISQKLDDGTIKVATIALTATDGLTGGWAPAEEVAKRALSRLGIDFVLPLMTTEGGEIYENR